MGGNGRSEIRISQAVHNKYVAYVTAEFISMVCSTYILPITAEVLVILMTLRQEEKLTRRMSYLAQDIASWDHVRIPNNKSMGINARII